MNHLDTYLKEINYLCEQHKVNKLYVFGSALSNNFNEKSDIDLIVDFNTLALEEYADNYFDFKFSLFVLQSEKLMIPYHHTLFVNLL